MHKTFRTLTILFLGLALSGLVPRAVFAQLDDVRLAAVMSPDQAQQTPAGKFIQDLGDKAIRIVADKSLAPKQRDQEYHELLHQAFDMPTIGHFVLGRAWNAATPEQRTEYMGLLESLVVKIYGDQLGLYSGETFKVTGIRLESEEDSVVSSEVTHADGTRPMPIDWRVRQKNGEFAVIDVVVEGVSQSITQRDEYASILQRNNGDLNALLDVMRQKVQQQDSTASSLSSKD